MSAELLTFFGGLLAVFLPAALLYLKDSKAQALQRMELESKIAQGRADDQVELIRFKGETESRTVERAEERMERLLNPLIQHERDARLKLENEVVVMRAELVTVKRDLVNALRMRCPLPQCPVFRAEFTD